MTQLELPGLPAETKDAIDREWAKRIREMFATRGEKVFRVRGAWRYGWVQSFRRADASPPKYDANQLVEFWHVRGFV